MQVYWLGPLQTHSGYGTHNRNIAFGLIKRGVDVILSPTENVSHLDDGEEDIIKKYSKREVIDEDKVIHVSLIPPAFPPDRFRYKVLYTVYESVFPHPGLINRCKLYDEVWFACKYNVKNAVKKGLSKRRVFYMPEGVDPVIFNKERRRWFKVKNGYILRFWDPTAYQGYFGDIDLPGDHFMFLYVGDWSSRKGCRELVQAFLGLKTDRKIILAVKASKPCKINEKSIDLIGIDIIEAAANVKDLQSHQIVIIDQHITDWEMGELFRSADCYVIPSKGEGFNLTALQAAACGVPVVTTAFGGHIDYLGCTYPWLIPVERRGELPEGEEVGCDFYKHQEFVYPNEAKMKEMMMWQIDGQKNIRGWTEYWADSFCRRWSWGLAVDNVERRIKEIELMMEM